MNLNNLFSQSKLDQYAAYLKSTSLSDASLKRKLSSLSSFQKFLVKNNLIKVQSIQNPPAFENGGFSKKRFSLNFIKERIKLPPFLYRYLIIFSLFVIGLGLGFTLYRQAFAQSTKNFAYTTASNPTIANRQLSFQGRLTDSSGNPITSSTNIVFKLYNTETVSTGTSLYTSATGNSQTVVPDENGIFSVVIGKTHGTEIPDSVFTENSAVYLEITAGGEVMSPRQPIATVAYALNSETLQGLPPSASGLKNTVLVVDELGNINLGETSPTIKSTSGTMGIEAQAVLIKATDGSGGNITINPDANGEIKLVTEGTGVSDGFINATNANLASGNLFNASINNDNRGYKFINFSNYDTSTTQLTSRFSVDAYGNTNVGGTLSTTNLAVRSSDLVNNLNSDLLDGQHSNYFVNIGQTGSLPYDNYNHWDLQTNGVGNTAILSGNAVNFINGVGISISQTGSVITIDNTSIGTTYTAGVGLTLSSTNVFSLDLASANTWTALQNLSAGATISNLSVGGTFLSVGSTNTVINLSANYLNGKSDTYFLGVGSTDNFITTLTAGTDISITGSGVGRTINDTSTLATITGREASTSTLLSLLGGAYFGSTSQSILKNDGSVGIGTTNPGAYKLNVNGSMNLASGQTYNIGGAQINLNNLSDVLISTPITDQILRYNGTSWVNGAETTVNGGAGVDLFYVDSPSDIVTYTILSKTPDAGGEIDETVTANNNQVLFDSYASPLPGFGGTQIDPGVWTFDIWAYVNDITSGNSSIDIDVYKRTTDDTETLLFSVNSGTLDTTLGLNPNVVTTIQQAFPINSTDRLVTKVYGKTTAVANRTIHFVHGGTSHYSHLNTPLVVRHNDLAGLQGGTASEYYHLTAAEYTGSGTGVFARINSPTFTGNFGIGGTDSNYSFHTTTNGRFDTNLEVGSTLTTTTLKATNAQDTTMITDLNADLLDGQHSSYFVNIGQTGNFITGLTAGTDISITGSGIGRTINDTSTLDTVLGRGASTTKQITIGYSGAPFVLSSGDTSTVTNLSADYLDGYNSAYFVNIGQTGNFITTISVGASGLSVTGSGIGRTLTNTGLVDITNSTLTRSGSSGTYTVGLNLGNVNTWTALQNLSAGATISNLSVGGTFLSVGSTNLVTNLNADLLDGQHSTYFVNIGQTGSLPYVNNTTNTTLTRSGTGPFTLGLNLASANTWTALQNLSAGATISTLSTTGNASIGGTLAVTGRSTFAQNVFVNAGGIGVTGNSVFTNNLTIGDTLTLSQGAQNGYVLTSDASGNAKWSVGSGTTYTAGVGLTLSSTNVFSLDLASANTWTALQNFSAGATISNLSVGGTFLSVGSTNLVTNLNADLLDGQHSTYFVNIGQTGNFITTISVGASGLSVTGSGIGRTLTNTGLVDITNSTLTRSGSSGTYTVGLNLGNVNTWTALQNLSAGATISNLSIGGTFLSVGSTNLVTNLNADLLDGQHSSAFEVPLTFTNGLTRTSNDIHLGGALTEDTRLNIGSTEALYIQYSTGNVGIGTASPNAKFEILTSVAGDSGNSLVLNNTGGTDGSGTAIYMGYLPLTTGGFYGARILQQSNPSSTRSSDLLFQIHGSPADNLDSSWNTPLMIQRTTGNVGIGTTNPAAKLDINGTARIIGAVTPTSGAGMELAYSAAGGNITNYDRTGSVYKDFTVNALNQHFYTSGTEQLTILSGGKIGIGTTNPVSKLQVNDGTITAGNLGDVLVGRYSSTYPDSATTAGYFKLSTNNTNNNSGGMTAYYLNSGSYIAGLSLVSNGNVGIGTTNPTEKLDVIGNIKASKFYDQDNPLYFIDPSNASSTNASLSLTTSGSIRFNSDVGGTHIVASSASRIQNYPNGLLLGVSTSTSGNIVGWDNNLFLNVSGNVGIGTTNPENKLEVYAGSDTSQILWGQSIRNAGNAVTNGYGSGLKLLISTTGDSANKWAGIAAVAGTGWSNRTDMAFYVNPTSTSVPIEKMRITGDGNVGIGTTNPTEKLDVIGNIKGSKFYDQDNPLYFIDPANAGSNNASLSLTTSGSIRFNSDVGGTHIVTSSASRIQNYPNGLLLGVSTSTSGNIVGWDNNLFLNVSGNVGIGTTNPTSNLHIKNSVAGSTTLMVEGNGSANVGNSLIKADGDGVLQSLMYGTAATGTLLGNTSAGAAYLITNSTGSTQPTLLGIGTLTNTPIIFGTSNTEKMRITGGGNVGIGTTNPQARLDISTASGTQMYLPNTTGTTDTSILRVGYFDNSWAGVQLDMGIYNGGNYPAWIQARDPTNYATNRSLLLNPNGGNVGIGTTNPGLKLDVIGDIRASGSLNIGTGGNYAAGSIYSDGNWGMLFRAKQASPVSAQYRWAKSDDSELMRINNSGNVGIGTASPTTKTHVYGTLTVEPLGITNSYSEGIRIGNASNGYSLVQFGANPASATGTQANQWWIGKDGSDNGFSIFGNTYGSNAFHILPSGQVGIGSASNTGEKLSVSGGHIGLSGTSSFYFTSYGGGWFMQDSSWIRSTNSKNVWLGSGIYGTDGALTIGAGGAVPQGKLWLQGGDQWISGGNYKLAFSTDGSTDPTPNVDIHAVTNTLYVENWNGSSLVNGMSISAGSSRVYGSLTVDSRMQVGNGADGWIALTDDESPNGIKYVHANSNAIGFVGGGGSWIFNVSEGGRAEAMGMMTAMGFNGRQGIYNGASGSYMNTAWTGGCIQQWVDATNMGNLMCPSDERIKKNIKSMTDLASLEAINKLNPVTFNWKNPAETTTDQYGFIAQEVQKIFPDLVVNTGMITPDTPDGMLRIEYNGFIPVAIKGIQQLDANITEIGNDLSLTSTGSVTVDYNISDSVLASLGYDGAKNEIESATYSLTDSTGAIVTRISQFSEIASAKIKAGLISATNIVTKNLIAEKINTKELISPKANIDQLTALDIQTTSITTDTLVATDIQTTSINTENLAADNATISGTLYADNIISKEGSFGDLMAQKVSAVRDELKKLITNNEASSSAITGTSIASLTSDWSMNIASDSAKIEGDLSISNNLVIGAKLLVNGDTQLANAFITGTFSAGEVSIKDNFIQTTNTALYIQPSNTGSIHIMGDTLVIADNGEVQINGNLAVSGSLFANLITASEIQTQKLTATEINSNQVKIATDSAQTIIADPGFAALATSSANLTSNATAGTATLPAGKTEIVINNNKITNNSMVYITPVGSTKNQVPYIKAKVISTSESYFTIALDNPLDQDIEINWWIIN